MNKAEKDFMVEKFTTLTTLVNAHFLTIDGRLGQIETQTKLTNGRVNELEKADIRHVLDCPAMPKIDEINDNLAEYKLFKKYPKIGVAVLGIGLLIILAGGLEIFNKLKLNASLVENRAILKANNDRLIMTIDSLKSDLKTEIEKDLTKATK
jgi:hypothetical protein